MDSPLATAGRIANLSPFLINPTTQVQATTIFRERGRTLRAEPWDPNSSFHLCGAVA